MCNIISYNVYYLYKGLRYHDFLSTLHLVFYIVTSTITLSSLLQVLFPKINDVVEHYALLS